MQRRSVSPEKAAQVTAFFVNVDTEAPLLYISVPCASTLLAREVLQKRISPSLTGPGGKVLSTHRPPQSRAAVTYPAVSAVAIDAAGPLARDVLMATPDGSLVLMHGPPGDAGAAIPLSLEKLGMSDESPSHLSRNGRLLRLDEPRGSVVTLHFENVKVSLHLDLSPRCETTRRVLDALRATMPAPVARTIRTDWIERRFGFVESQESGAAVDDWQTLVRVLTGESSARQKHPILDDPWSALLSSTSHASYKDDPCLPPLTNGYESPGRSDEPAKIDAGLPPEHLAVALASIHLVAQDARLDMTMGERDLGRLAELLVGMAARLGNSDWADYWFRLVPDSATKAHCE